MDVFLGSVSLFAFNFAPPGWAQCNGQIMNISQSSALFALLGTFYGGNGTSTFALPDLRGRVPIGMGQGTGQPTNYNIGQTGGAASTTLTVANLAPHTHAGGVNIVAGTGRGITIDDPPVAGDYLTASQSASPSGSPATTSLGGVTTQSVGQGQAFSIMPPYLALNYCIATQGIFPTRQ